MNEIGSREADDGDSLIGCGLCCYLQPVEVIAQASVLFLEVLVSIYIQNGEVTYEGNVLLCYCLILFELPGFGQMYLPGMIILGKVRGIFSGSEGESCVWLALLCRYTEAGAGHYGLGPNDEGGSRWFSVDTEDSDGRGRVADMGSSQTLVGVEAQSLFLLDLRLGRNSFSPSRHKGHLLLLLNCFRQHLQKPVLCLFARRLLLHFRFNYYNHRIYQVPQSNYTDQFLIISSGSCQSHCLRISVPALIILPKRAKSFQ